METANKSTPPATNMATMGNNTSGGSDDKTLDATTTTMEASSDMKTTNNNTDHAKHHSMQAQESTNARGSGDINNDPNNQRQIELEEEKKLRAKHPCIQRPGSEFLQKRLQRGQKYFDSGDYNMAKASTNSTIKLPDNATPVTAIDSKLLNKRH